MIFADTNILVRLATNDDPAQRSLAMARLAQCGSNEVNVSDVVVAEMFFVLASQKHYGMSRADICSTLSDLFSISQFFVSREALPAIVLARNNKKLDITDCLLAVYADGSRDNLLSFDKDLLKILKT